MDRGAVWAHPSGGQADEDVLAAGEGRLASWVAAAAARLPAGAAAAVEDAVVLVAAGLALAASFLPWLGVAVRFPADRPGLTFIGQGAYVETALNVRLQVHADAWSAGFLAYAGCELALAAGLAVLCRRASPAGWQERWYRGWVPLAAGGLAAVLVGARWASLPSRAVGPLVARTEPRVGLQLALAAALSIALVGLVELARPRVSAAPADTA